MYLKFYALTKKPFQLTPDPVFFYNSAVHKRGLAYLRYGLEQGEGFIVVTGSPGTGKTMLIKELLATLQGDEILPGLVVTTQVGADDVLIMIAGAFGLNTEGATKAVVLQQLESFFKQKAREKKRLLLVVDEAQHLPYQSLEELRMLLNLELEGKPIIQIFMLGQEELRFLLQNEKMVQIRQRITATYHLRPLDKEETREYIEHRLVTAGWHNDPVITDEAFDEIYQYSNGTPRIINTVCDRLFLYGFLEELHKLDIDAARMVIHEIAQDNYCPQTEIGLSSTLYPTNYFGSEERIPLANEQNLEKRLIRIENQVDNLTQTIQKERALLRKAILLQLEMDDVYDTPTKSTES